MVEDGDETGKPCFEILDLVSLPTGPSLCVVVLLFSSL